MERSELLERNWNWDASTKGEWSERKKEKKEEKVVNAKKDRSVDLEILMGINIRLRRRVCF